MKLIVVAILSFGLFACSPSANNAPQGTVNTQGGVDVGNMNGKSAAVPRSNAYVNYEKGWGVSYQNYSLNLNNQHGSTVTAERADLKDVSSPTPLSLKQRLQQLHPDRTYDIVNYNGLEGARADFVNTSEQKQSDLYLVSELGDVIHIQSALKAVGNGITEGDHIITTVRIKYQGVAYPQAKARTITLEARHNDVQDRFAYSILDDCYTYSGSCNGRGVAVAYEGTFEIGTAGYDHGRIVELGPDSETPFDAIQVEGEYLVAPQSKTPLSDIYTVFTPKDQQSENDRVQLKEGYVYLVRTISWPDEDMITKIRVEKVNGGTSATLTYEKLVYVKHADLQKQVDALNAYTKEFEQPISLGEVTLYNRAISNNYFYASFNFQYSTSGNMFITSNGWDLHFETGCNGKPVLNVSRTGSGIAQLVDLGAKDLSQVTLADLPNPNSFKRDCGLDVVQGHSYILYHYDFGDANSSYVAGAVQVLDLDPQGRWVRLKFHRLQVSPADEFQQWVNLPLPTQTMPMTLDSSSSEASTFLPLVGRRADQGQNSGEISNERIYFNAENGNLDIDDRPYGNRRGFFKLAKNTNLESVTAGQIDGLAGQFVDYINVKAGDVIAVRVENFYDRALLVMRVEASSNKKVLALTVRYIERAKTVYAEE